MSGFHTRGTGKYANLKAHIASAVMVTAPLVLQYSIASAQDNGNVEPEQEEILVFGRAIDLVGAADSASEGLVGYDDLTTRPLLRVGELVEVIPGMIATQHSGGGKANQYFLRGMNLDHGTDFSIQFEGMPVNFRTHAHGQGYLDMNFIIPELVSTIEYRKGTYSADVGDFSAASSSKFETYDRLDRGFVDLTHGTENYLRAVAANSWDVASGSWLLGAELRLSDGPWENAEGVKLFNGFAKYTTRLWGKSAELVATAYTNEWNATDQIPQRAVTAGVLGRYGFIDPSVGGETSRFNLIANLEGDRTSYQAFASKYSLNLFGNPTYFLNDAINGDQIEQEDGRWILGGRVDSTKDLQWGNRDVALAVGADTRYDRISDVNLFLTSHRSRSSSVRADDVDEFSVGAYADVQVSWTEQLRTTLGLRTDHYRWDVTALRSENSGSGSDTIVNPKIGIAYNFNDQWEIYANYGGGFHSNDVRAAELRVDPATGAPAESFAAIVEAEGVETGFRAEISDRLNFSATFFSLKLDSELIFVGDAGTTEPNEGTERKGVEAALFWRPTDWLALDVSAAKTDAEFSDAPAGENAIPDAHDVVGAFGATVALNTGFVGSLRVRHFGDAPLVEDNSARKDGTTLVNLGLSYPLGDFELGLDILNLFDSGGHDIEYFYESRLFDEAEPVEDFHFHPVEPREFRFRLRYQF
jgi:outer membrane receptor protein involved in Fe transport